MKKGILLLVLLFFVISVVWEVSHSGLYDWSKPPLKDDLDYKFWRLSASIFGDVSFLIFILLFVSMFKRSVDWIFKAEELDYLFVFIFGVMIGLVIEYRSVGVRWSYLDSMPMIFGIGVSPLLQLGVTGVLGLWVVNKLGK